MGIACMLYAFRIGITFQNLQSVITSKRYWLDNKKRSALHCVPIVGDIGIEPMTPSV